MLSWTTLNPTCKIRDTAKKYYGQYLYKAVLKIPAGRIINNRDFNLSIKSLLDFRRNSAYRLSRHPYTKRLYEHLKDASEIQIKYWQDTLDQHKNFIKHRIEEPFVQLYSNDEKLLFDIISGDPTALKELYRPVDRSAELALNNNEIVVKRSNGYNYKIYLREGYQLTADLRDSIGQYLVNLGDEVKLTKGTVYNFTKKRLWFNGTYFYAKDDSVITFLNLMAPGIVAGIFKLTCITQ